MSLEDLKGMGIVSDGFSDGYGEEGEAEEFDNDGNDESFEPSAKKQKGDDDDSDEDEWLIKTDFFKNDIQNHLKNLKN